MAAPTRKFVMARQGTASTISSVESQVTTPTGPASSIKPTSQAAARLTTTASTGAAAPASGRPAPWSNPAATRKSVGGHSLLQTAVTNARNSVAPQSITTGTANLNLNSKPKPPSDIYDPSNGPLATRDGGQKIWQGSACPDENTMGQYNVDISTDTCESFNRSARDFLKGEVIALPHHEPNLNPNNKIGHTRLAQTCEGYVFSKRRMFVILHKYERDLFCLPLYSHENRGIGHKPENIRREYVCLKQEGIREFKNQGEYEPVEIRTYDPSRPMRATTAIQLVGGMKVGVTENISYVGRLTWESYERLLELYEERNRVSQRKGWEPDRRTGYGRGQYARAPTMTASRAQSAASWRQV